jgi:hypothetical protein
MRITSIQLRPLAQAPLAQWLALVKRFFFLLLVGALFLAVWPASAQQPDDRYLRILSSIQQADALDSSGKPDQALAKYRDAQTALQKFQRGNPNWQPQVVISRLNYLSERITTLAEKTGTPIGGEPTTNQEGQAASKPGASSSATQTKLLDAGAEPRKVLRLHPSVGGKQTVEMTIKMGMDIKAGEMPGNAMKLPAITMPLDLTVKNITPDGTITYELVMGDAKIAEEAGAAAPMAEMMKTALGGLKGLAGTGTITDRGVSKGMEFKAAAGTNPQLKQTLDQMKESFSTLSWPFPEEAVGAGAKWEAKGPVKSQGMNADQDATYELVSVEGDRLTTKVNITQQAANQKIQSPAMPGKVDVTKMTGTTSGNCTLDLTQVMPPKVDLTSHSDMAMAVSMGGQKQTMSMKMDMNVLIESK